MTTGLHGQGVSCCCYDWSKILPWQSVSAQPAATVEKTNMLNEWKKQQRRTATQTRNVARMILVTFSLTDSLRMSDNTGMMFALDLHTRTHTRTHTHTHTHTSRPDHYLKWPSGKWQYIVTLCLKKWYHPITNDNFNNSCPIPVIFGTNITERICHQTVV